MYVFNVNNYMYHRQSLLGLWSMRFKIQFFFIDSFGISASGTVPCLVKHHVYAYPYPSMESTHIHIVLGIALEVS